MIITTRPNGNYNCSLNEWLSIKGLFLYTIKYLQIYLCCLFPNKTKKNLAGFDVNSYLLSCCSRRSQHGSSYTTTRTAHAPDTNRDSSSSGFGTSSQPASQPSLLAIHIYNVHIYSAIGHHYHGERERGYGASGRDVTICLLFYSSYSCTVKAKKL